MLEENPGEIFRRTKRISEEISEGTPGKFFLIIHLEIFQKIFLKEFLGESLKKNWEVFEFLVESPEAFLVESLENFLNESQKRSLEESMTPWRGVSGDIPAYMLGGMYGGISGEISGVILKGLF